MHVIFQFKNKLVLLKPLLCLFQNQFSPGTYSQWLEFGGGTTGLVNQWQMEGETCLETVITFAILFGGARTWEITHFPFKVLLFNDV